VPVMPSSLLDPVWVQFEALLPTWTEVHPDHPLGCHRRHIPDRVVFEHVVAALVHGSGYERIATPACSDTTIRHRLKAWAAAGIGQLMHAAALAAYEQIVGLDLDTILIDGCITKAVCGGESTGKSPVDRGKIGIKRSQATDGAGIPIGQVTAGANCHDSPLLAPTLDAARALTGHLWPAKPVVHLDAGYDSQITRDLLKEQELGHEITWKGFPEPIQHTRRWPCERTHAWMNGYGKLRRITDENPEVIDFYWSIDRLVDRVDFLRPGQQKVHTINIWHGDHEASTATHRRVGN
jgi:hypothetical protein